MLKNILKLDGAQSLNKAEQRTINGGGIVFTSECFPTLGACQAQCNHTCVVQAPDATETSVGDQCYKCFNLGIVNHL